MSGVGGKVNFNFRQSFRVVQKEALRWFPGHMNKSLKQMQQKLKNVDCVIEIHDARVPLSGRCINLQRSILGLKPHIFVLNKSDLADMQHEKSIISHLNEEGIKNVLFTNVKNQKCKITNKILPLARELIQNSNRYNRQYEESFMLMIIGVPNVGKSSLINTLRNRILKKANAAPVGPFAGVTRSVGNHIKVSEKPDIFLIDTPGILSPTVTDIESGLKLALVGCLRDHLVGEEIIADYLLFLLNKYNHFKYMEIFNMSKPNDNILEILTMIAARERFERRIRNYDGQMLVKPDLSLAANYFIKLFRTGKLGKFCLDQDLLNVDENKLFSNISS